MFTTRTFSRLTIVESYWSHMYYFSHRFRMSHPLFLRIVNDVAAHDNYFIQKRNAANTLGASTLQKATAAFRVLCYWITGDAVDEYVRIGESTIIESVKRLVRGVVHLFQDEYLRSPTEADTARLLSQGEERGFPGMLSSIDCMHWRWKNYPSAW